MNQHLSRDQISKCLIGDGSPQETQHVWECAACSAELARVEFLRAVSRNGSSLERRESVTEGAIAFPLEVRSKPLP